MVGVLFFLDSRLTLTFIMQANNLRVLRPLFPHPAFPLLGLEAGWGYLSLNLHYLLNLVMPSLYPSPLLSHNLTPRTNIPEQNLCFSPTCPLVLNTTTKPQVAITMVFLSVVGEMVKVIRERERREKENNGNLRGMVGFKVKMLCLPALLVGVEVEVAEVEEGEEVGL